MEQPDLKVALAERPNLDVIDTRRIWRDMPVRT
jgi:hypothetical protein